MGLPFMKLFNFSSVFSIWPIVKTYWESEILIFLNSLAPSFFNFWTFVSFSGVTWLPISESEKIWVTVWAKVGFNPYPRILGKNPKCGTVTERVLREKNPERSVASFCICSHVLEFFSGKRARWRSQKMAYIFVQNGIFPHILAYAIWNKHHKIAQLTLYLNI